VKPPPTIVVGPHAYAVVADQAAIDRLSVEAGEARLGECDTRRLTITVDPSQADSQLAETIVHELLHASFSLIGAGEDVTPEIEEKLVLRLAPVLLQVIADNPRLVTWLTS
jgi:hypothetical protein